MISLKSFSRAVILALAFGTSVPASAAVIADWGTLAPASIGSYMQTVVSDSGTTTFSHDYTFQVSGHAALKTVALNFNAFEPRNIYGLQAMLFRVDGDTDVLLASSPIGDGSTYETLALAYSNIQTVSDYFIRIIGTVVSGAYGTYAGMYELSPAPLPAAVWLFGTGLVGLAAIGRKRRNKGVTPASV